jgi:glycosyltransferase involved in cell wall biosynthesis
VRLLHVSQPTGGGVGHFVRDLVAAGVRAGHEVTIACPEGGLSASARAVGACWIPLNLTQSPTAADLANVWRLRAIAKTADVVIVHSSKAGAVGRLAAMLARPRPPCIFTPHGWSWLVGGRMAPVYRLIEKRLASSAYAIVAVSEEDFDVGRRVLGARAQLVTIPNGVDTTRFTPDGPAADRPAAPLIVCVGRLTEAKGQADAIAALPLLAANDAVVRLVGAGEDQEMLHSLAVELGVFHRVEFVGEVDDTASQYRAADVVVVPSRWDAQSLVLLEAMACGAAIVGALVPGSAALRGVGELVDPRSPSQLAASIDVLLASQRLRDEYGAKARERAVEHFELSRSMDTWQQLWEEAARWR